MEPNGRRNNANNKVLETIASFLIVPPFDGLGIFLRI